jgi:prepilin-type N-terminal cleavage/methylation domain-containing protein
MKKASFSLHNKGFTVLEFLVVMFIMGILIALVLAGFARARERARDEVRIAAVQNIALALEQYRAICGNYPPTIIDIGADQYCAGTATQLMQLENFIPILPVLPDPADEYFYAGIARNSGSTEKCIGYHLGVRLENANNSFLGEDDDADAVSSAELCDNSDNDFDGSNDTNEKIYDMRN